ncbi:Icc-related predicted phosphoesterase [Nitrospirillum amazonense]|uniref:Icc-related predicted phosphoesterase n=1 Tax=Nitrospirillum amazonense TaxID=28077 RepID=A0A560EUC8_9PROT|nr:metallophosphoesterase [Nitrospirillum amazonense]TWB12956.1 Icc-related predicted phosphoesterase [Nitrospirillum amazonense]
MVRIAVFSDLHSEFSPWAPPPDLQADVVVLAGDLWTRGRGVRWGDARETFGCPHVVAVAGNHDLYGTSIDDGMLKLRGNLAAQGVTLLERGETIVHGVRFLGATLWTDVRLFAGDDLRRVRADATMLVGERHGPRIADYWRIRVARGGYRRLRPRDTATLHQTSVAWLDERLAAPHDGPTVVVSHHAPSAQCLPAGARHDPWSCAYASHLDWLIERHRPAAWVYGHIHDPSPGFVVGGTPLLANPRGYDDDDHGLNPRFDPYGLQLEI